MAAEATVHQLKVTLRGVLPPVWRRVVLTSGAPLSELAELLEAAMGWLGGHLHSFDTGRLRSIEQKEPTDWTAEQLRTFLGAAAGHRFFPAL